MKDGIHACSIDKSGDLAFGYLLPLLSADSVVGSERAMTGTKNTFALPLMVDNLFNLLPKL